ncbi:hypothetical protein BV20DRAFT_304056 [Pilatotrama ljubarskyi]|nr:hypothetical protein BV20DRAFT_304056 [Pilatotrama ljubarskyi]
MVGNLKARWAPRWNFRTPTTLEAPLPCIAATLLSTFRANARVGGGARIAHLGLRTSPAAAMSAGTAEKTSRTHKKDKTKTDTASDGGAVGAGADNPKKSKKAKGDSTKPAATDVSSEVVDAQPANVAGDVAKAKKEKKHKKHKYTEEEEGERTQHDVEEKKKRKQDKSEAGPAQSLAEPEGTKPEKKSKKKEKKKGKSKDAEVEEESTQDASAEAVADKAAAHSEERSSKQREKKKKDKKRKQPADEEGEEDQAAPTKPAKKRKRRTTTSGFPDPTDDEALTEQAQKALHYAFTQFEDPSEWKFNKARQNWIIRNLWSEEAIPETYMPLVSRYLQGVQGGACEALIKACRDALSQPAAESTSAEGAEVAAETENEGDSPTKRTVKFAVPETKSSTGPADSTSAKETKRQRATALLAVLTASSS